MLRLACEPLSQLGVLRRHADRARAEVALSHHHAAEGYDRGRAETELVGPEHRADDHVAPGAQLPVDLHADAVPQAVEDQHLLRLAKPQLPGDSRVLDRAERACSGAAVVAADEHLVGVALCHARGNRAHADLRDELDGNLRLGVGAPQVVDELGEVLDGVDVVVRRGADERHARRRVAQAGDLLGDLVPGKLPALAGLGALGHLYLKLAGVGEVKGRNAEPAAGDLLDGAVAAVAVGIE